MIINFVSPAILNFLPNWVEVLSYRTLEEDC